jgi:bifunctional ADP-heptose synthase (sugar kinase/adenylyltransferase)
MTRPQPPTDNRVPLNKSQRKVVVVGDVMIDRCLTGRVEFIRLRPRYLRPRTGAVDCHGRAVASGAANVNIRCARLRCEARGHRPDAEISAKLWCK